MTQPTSPLVDALQRVGDRWSLLVIDALMDGPMRFNDLARTVEGIAPNTLSHRLRRLERDGVLVGEPYSERPLRHSYRLTNEGQDLAGVLRLLATWGRGAEMTGEGLHHETCGTSIEARWYCPTCARLVEERESTELRRI